MMSNKLSDLWSDNQLNNIFISYAATFFAESSLL